MTIEIAVVSGKGGTGKTAVTASLASLMKGVTLADCDVDASNLHIILHPSIKERKPYYGLNAPVVDTAACEGCGACEAHCRFDAISIRNDIASLDIVSCEGCGVCELVCPVNAIRLSRRLCGDVYVCEASSGPMVYAMLEPGAGTSGKLVTMVREEARTMASRDGIMLMDGPPGTGCPVIATISGAHIALIVVEPTVSGLSDMKRVLRVARRFNAVPCVCINKYDINEDMTGQIEGLCREEGVNVAGKIPFDREVYDCICKGAIPVECVSDRLKTYYHDVHDSLMAVINEIKERKTS